MSNYPSRFASRNDIDSPQLLFTEDTDTSKSCRAQFKDKPYFDEYISKQRRRIEKISSMASSSPDSSDSMLSNMYMNLISAEYSDGMSKEEISDDVKKMFSHIKTVDSYAAMVDYLSLAILFNINGDEISNVLSNNRYDDDLVSKLKKALGSSATGEGVKYKSYKTFDDMLDDKISSEEFLNYVNNNWYEDSSDRYWYDSHNSNENTYTGYWCWVGAAVAQIKNIDTTGSKYIPSELINSSQEITQEGMFVPGFNNLRMKIAQALGDKFKVTNVFKDMSGKEKFDISKADADILTDIKTSVESTGTGCKVISRCVGFAPKIHFNNISLSQALDKILELFEKPELLLEGAMLSRFRNSYYMESDTDDIDGELDKTLEDIESSVNDTDDDDPDNNEDIDIDSFGSDTSDVQNEYSQKDIEILNHLIAGESEAINDYFDGAKDSNNETLRRLYGDIGHEERFHLEQLLYAKSTLTGEKYEPRDPEVKKEYEELLAMGMDEETAASTAIDKQGMVGYDDGDDSDMEKLEQETAMIATMLLHNEILTSFCEYFNTHQIDNAVSVFVEAYIMEEMDNVASAPKQVTKIQDPLTLLVKGLQLSINGLIRMGTAIRDSVVKSKLKNYRKWEWIKKNGITGLFANGIHLYLYSDQSSKYDTDTPARYVDLLYRLTKQIGENCGIRLTDAAKHKTISNPIQFNTISEGLNKLKKVVLTKTKVVVNENNKDMLAREFFGYSSEKLNVAVTHGNSETAVRDSNNIYSRLDVLMLLTKEYSKISMEVLNHLKGFEGDSNSIYYKNRKMFNLALDGMKLIVEKYNQFIKAMASDLNTIIKLDNGLLAMTRMRDSTEQSGGKWEGEDIRTQNGVLSKGAPNKYATDKKLPRTPHKW